MKKILALLALLVFIAPTTLQAVTNLPFGSACTSDSECASGGCEVAHGDPTIEGKYFCDCGDHVLGSADDDFCRNTFQSAYPNLPESGWECVDGTKVSGDLDYCQNANVVEYPLGPQKIDDPGLVDAVVGAMKDTPLTENEINSMLAKPEPRIKIPGLDFSEARINKVTDEEGGGTYIIIPFLGEYLAAIYKYAIIIASIVSVIILIVAGFQWIVPDSSGENASDAKSRIAGALSGLIITVGSYTILYTINPELVQFRSLRIPYIVGLADDMVHDDEEVETGPIASNVAENKNLNETVKNRCHLIDENDLPTFDLNSFTDKGIGQCLLKEYTPNIGTGGLASVRKDMVKTTFLGKNITVHQLALDAFKRTELAIQQAGSPITAYWVQNFYTAGTYVDGKSIGKTLAKCEEPGPETWIVTKANGTQKSRLLTRVWKNINGNHSDSIRGDMHSLGLAIDVYSLENPDYGSERPLATNIPAEVADAFYANGFSWLGATGGRDTMHFQYFGSSCFSGKGNKYPSGNGCCMNGWKKGGKIPVYSACIKQGGTASDYSSCLGPGGKPQAMWVKETR